MQQFLYFFPLPQEPRTLYFFIILHLLLSFYKWQNPCGYWILKFFHHFLSFSVYVLSFVQCGQAVDTAHQPRRTDILTVSPFYIILQKHYIPFLYIKQQKRRTLNVLQLLLVCFTFNIITKFS